MLKQRFSTASAPAAIGPYAQAVGFGNLVFLSGQIGLHPATGQLVEGGIETQVRQAFANLEAVARASGGGLADAVKLTLFLTDLSQFAQVNALMATLMPQPYPARSTVEVAALPRGALFEVDAILALDAPATALA